MNRRLRTYAYAVLLALLPAAGWTDDRWEAGTYRADDTSATANELVHGSVQRNHDLQGVLDQDWMVLRSKTRHSYEARVSSGSAVWNPGTCDNCAGFDRVTAAGSVLTAGVADGAIIDFASTLVVRWIADTGANEYLRADGAEQPHCARHVRRRALRHDLLHAALQQLRARRSRSS